jgi:hypothetical protein
MISPGERPPPLKSLLQVLGDLLQDIFEALTPRKPRVPPEEALRAADQFVRSGATARHVRRVLGSPNDVEAGEWIYLIDPRRGWRIVFSPTNRVERVDFWVR